jgi:excisionase family DNA binding protein
MLLLFSFAYAADYTGIGRNTLRKLVEWEKLPVLKVGRKVLIKTDMLEKFMEVNEGRDLRDKSSVKAVTRKVIT